MLCTYVVAGLDNCRFVMVLNRELIFFVSVSFVGAVSPSIFSTVPKCAEYGALSSGWCSPIANRVCVFMVVSTGHCLSKFQAKL